MNDPSTSLELTKSSSGSVSDEDIELKAIQTVLTALSGLRGEARSRVVEYVFKRLGLMSEAVPISTAVGDYQLPTPADIARSTSTKGHSVIDTGEGAPQLHRNGSTGCLLLVRACPSSQSERRNHSGGHQEVLQAGLVPAAR